MDGLVKVQDEQGDDEVSSTPIRPAGVANAVCSLKPQLVITAGREAAEGVR